MKPEEKLLADRRKKLDNIREKSIDPYPYSFDRKNFAKDILDKNKNLEVGNKNPEKVSVAGRIMSLRDMGKTSFCHIQDQTGKIQIYFKEDDMKDDFHLLKDLDMGDIIGLNGYVFKTQKGEVSVYAEKLTILCKALRPLPEKWHGLKDKETRYRQRHVDMIVNEEVRKVFFTRSLVLKYIREFLDKDGFIEVETPLLQPVYGGASAKPFTTFINNWDMKMYLSISPELYLKRLITGGMEKVYTICKNFRNESADKSHNPEFTMLEWYNAYADYNDTMSHFERLVEYVTKKILGTTKIKYQGKEFDVKTPWKKLTISEAIKEYASLSVEGMSKEDMIEILERHKQEFSKEDSKGILALKIFEALVEEKLDGPIHIIDHPWESTPLCKLHRKDKELIERCEPYINGWEIGNIYSELNDPDIQKRFFDEQLKLKQRGDEEAHPMDEDFINVIGQGMPPTGGAGLGVDRLTILLTDSESIRDVIAFPTMKPEE